MNSNKGILLESGSPKITKKIAYLLAQSLDGGKFVGNQGCLLISLKGDLGSGKTTFVSGFLNYFKINPLAKSPTFVILKRYLPKKSKVVENIFHLDAYRLKSKKDLSALNFKNFKKTAKSVMLVEWPERIKGIKFDIKIEFDYGPKPNERKIRIK